MRRGGSRALRWVVGLAVLLSAGLAAAEPAVTGVAAVSRRVADLSRARAFYVGTLDFVAEPGAPPGRLMLRLGDERIELVDAPDEAPAPPPPAGNDAWFQHLALVVADIDRAHARLRAAGATPISLAPQRLPDWNANAAGIRAFYFRDPDGHPLELIWYPPGRGDPRWQRPAAGRLFLGIDHTAIAVADTEASLAFYRDRLGLRVAGAGENWGAEQDGLNGVPGSRVRITALRAAAGPGIELLEYVAPGEGRPYPALPPATVTLLHGAPAAALRDPDGHALQVVP